MLQNINSKSYMPISPKRLSFGQKVDDVVLDKKLDEAVKAIDNAGRIAIVTHNNPDGDAIGSSCALKNEIQQKYPDKKVDAFVVNNISEGLKCIDDSKDLIILQYGNEGDYLDEKYDLAISVDCPRKSFMKQAGKIFDNAGTRISIDHHERTKDKDNPKYEDENYETIQIVDKNSSSAAQMMLKLAEKMNVPINKNLASDVYLAMVTDTGGFRFMKNPAKDFQDASKLAEAGADVKRIYNRSMDRMTKPMFDFYKKALNSVKFSPRVGMAYCIEDEIGLCVGDHKLDRSERGAVMSRITNTIMPNIEGAKLAAKINTHTDKYTGKRTTTASVRGDLDYADEVKEIAEALGGGGHPGAASCKVQGTDSRQLLSSMEDYIKENGIHNKTKGYA